MARRIHPLGRPNPQYKPCLICEKKARYYDWMPALCRECEDKARFKGMTAEEFIAFKKAGTPS